IAPFRAGSRQHQHRRRNHRITCNLARALTPLTRFDETYFGRRQSGSMRFYPLPSTREIKSAEQRRRSLTGRSRLPIFQPVGELSLTSEKSTLLGEPARQQGPSLEQRLVRYLDHHVTVLGAFAMPGK